jgi:rfaE bifunctional protein nucleotidyltransferase chain/domain
MIRTPREQADSVYRARAVFIEAASLAHSDGRERGGLDRLARFYRIVAVGQRGARPRNSANGIAEFARSNAIELYASWFVGNAPDLGFRGVLAGGAADRIAHALATIEKSEADSRILVGSERLEGLVASLRGRGARIVFTNGVFDLLHIGHLRLLEKARQLGGVLLAGINSDDSTRKIKGASRPIVPQFARAETLIALRAVDYCCIFTETDPKRMLAIVRPDTLAKGCDYSLSRVIGARFVAGYGGNVVRLPLVDGCSTTSTIRRIHDRRGRA